jgi:hypothetical protein
MRSDSGTAIHPPSQPPITTTHQNGKTKTTKTKPKKPAHWISKAPAAAEKASAQTSSSSGGGAAAEIAPRRQRAAIIVCCALLVAWCVRKSMCVCVVMMSGVCLVQRAAAGRQRTAYIRAPALPVTPKFPLHKQACVAGLDVFFSTMITLWRSQHYSTAKAAARQRIL